MPNVFRGVHTVQAVVIDAEGRELQRSPPVPFVVQQTSILDPIDIWLAILTGHATRCILSVIRFNQGKWRHIVIE